MFKPITQSSLTIMIFSLIPLIMGLYLCIRFILPWIKQKWLRLPICLLLLFLAELNSIVRLSSDNFFNPEIQRWQLLLATSSFGWILFLFVLTVIKDILLLIRKVLPFPFLRKERLYPLLLILSMGLTLFSVYEGTRVPDVKYVTIKIDQLPPSFHHYRIVQLTDTHISPIFPKQWAASVVNKTNELQADLILITGDLIDGLTAQRSNDIAPLATLKAKDGVITSLGNHEYYFDANAWSSYFAKQLGMRMLNNDHHIITKGTDQLMIAGVTDPTALNLGLEAPDTQKAIGTKEKTMPIILMSHQPKGAHQNALLGVDLQLSGHTHGGLLIGLNYLVAKFNEGFVSGLYHVDQMQLYVSNGTGLWNGFPFRLGVPSEITVFTLEPR